MPDRLVREKILDSDRVNRLSFGAEVFYRRLMSIADDFGRYEARIPALRGNLYPVRFDDITLRDVEGWLKECVDNELLLLYNVDGRDYIEIHNFRQRLRSMKSKYPPPSAGECLTHGRQMTVTCQTNDGHPPDGCQSSAGEEKGSESGREEKRSEEKGGEEEAPDGAGAATPPPSPPQGENRKQKQEAMLVRQKKFDQEIRAFAGQFSDEMLQAFYRYWSEPNKGRTKMRFELEQTWELPRRLSTWEAKDHQYKKGKQEGPAPAGVISARDLDSLYGRFLEGAELKALLNEKHCDFLLQTGAIAVNENHVFTAVQYQIKNLTGTNMAGELRALAAYQSGNWATDPDCRADEPNRTRIAKKLAAIELFNRCKTANLKTLEDAKSKLT
jgi:hypothetical protein